MKGGGDKDKNYNNLDMLLEFPAIVPGFCLQLTTLKENNIACTHMETWIYLQFWSKLERNSQSFLLPTAEFQLTEKIKQKPGYRHGQI